MVANREEIPPAASLVAPHAARLRPSDIRLITQRIVDRGLTPLRLDIGEPDAPTPEHIVEAAALAARSPSRYAPALGTLEFRNAASTFMAREHGIEVAPDDVVATSGATGALAAVFALLCAPGDEVLVPTPGFPSYRTQLALVNARPVGYFLDPGRGWEPDFDTLEGLIGPRTKAIVINSPANPTGAVFSASTIDRLIRLADEHDLAIVSDEVYLDLALDGTTTSALSRGRDRVFGLFSMSKSFSMTGWRIGFCVAPSGLAVSLGAVTAQLIASVSSTAQQAAVAAMTGPSGHLAERRSLYRGRRDDVHRYLQGIGVEHIVPRGGFYQILPLPEGADSLQVALRLLDEGVAVVPGSAFGENGSPFLRMCLTAPNDTLLRGLEIVRRTCW